MKKGKPTANQSAKDATKPIVAQEAPIPVTLDQCRVALINNGELAEVNEESEDDTSLAGLDEKALKKMVRTLRNQLKTQTVSGDLYKKMLEIASEDSGVDYLKKPGAGQ